MKVSLKNIEERRDIAQVNASKGRVFVFLIRNTASAEIGGTVSSASSQGHICKHALSLLYLMDPTCCTMGIKICNTVACFKILLLRETDDASFR